MIEEAANPFADALSFNSIAAVKLDGKPDCGIDEMEDVNILHSNSANDIENLSVIQSTLNNLSIHHSGAILSFQNFKVQVSDPTKRSDNLGPSYTLYKVTTVRNGEWEGMSKEYDKQNVFTVYRRYSDFVKFFNLLCKEIPGMIFPPLPEKSLAGRFNETFISRRMYGLSSFINKIMNISYADHSSKTLYVSDLPLVVRFITECNFKEMVLSKPKKNSFFNLFRSEEDHSIRDSFIDLGTDAWALEKKEKILDLEEQLEHAIYEAKSFVNRRNEMIKGYVLLARSLDAMDSIEGSKTTEIKSMQLSVVLEDISLIHEAQSENDFMFLINNLEEHHRYISSLKLAFNLRTLSYQKWIKARLNTLGKNEQVSKAQIMEQPGDKIDALNENLSKAKNDESLTKQNFEAIDKRIQEQLGKFDCMRVQEIQFCITEFLQSLLNCQDNLIQKWKEFPIE